jgi:hypothetical protein
MSFNLNSLWLDWRAKVPDGTPNPDNAYHLVLLKELCFKQGIDKDIIDNVILVLEKEGDDDKYTSVGHGYYKLNKDIGPDGKGKDGTPTFEKDDNDKYVETDGGEGGEKEKEPTKQTSIKVNPYDKKDDDKEGGKEKPKSKEELEQIDHQITDDTLVYTNSQAEKDQSKTGGRKGVGLGTDVSRAGEAAVHKGIRMMIEGDSIEEIDSLLRGVANEPDTFLNEKWVDAAVASIQAIDKEIGIKNIKTVAWDTDGGRESIGVNTKLKTSADMFVRTNNGRNIGISLKDSGDVFLANGGWKEQSDNLLNELESDMPEVEHGQLKEAMDIDTFKENRALSFQNVLNQLGTDGLEQMIKNIQDDSSKPIGKYIDKLSDVPSLINKIESENLSGDEMKAIAKMLKVSDKELEQTLRGPEKQLVSDTFDILNSSVEAKRGMNKWILKNMHVFDSLGLNENLKSGGVDEFITVFGTKPDGSVMKEESIKDLFGSQVSDMLIENLKEIKNGNMKPEELEDYMADRMELDHETGRINFRHENNLKYPLFYLAGRTRGIGTAPVLEIHSTPMFERSLEAGTFNTDEWSPEQLKRLKGDFKKAAIRSDDKFKEA